MSRVASAKRFAVDVRHDVVEKPAGLARVEQREDVRVLKPGGGLDFLQKPIGTERGRQVGAEHLDRDRAAVADVVREVHRRHAALSELALEHVAVTQGVDKTYGR